jgi:hypothetical protein
VILSDSGLLDIDEHAVAVPEAATLSAAEAGAQLLSLQALVADAHSRPRSHDASKLIVPLRLGHP